jgi:alpha-1,3-rhamnosyl/mannosyltransferase
MTVHDLTPVRFPELCHRDTLVYPELIRRAAADGAWVHTDSDAVRHEVIDLLGVDADRVVSVPLGFSSMAGGDATRGRGVAGGRPFALAVSTVEPRKDLPALLAAIDALARDGTEIPLLHVGGDGWGTDAFERARARMARPDLVTRLGRLPDAELRDLYAAARLVAYPSVYEGFGLPVLEAMSAGVPVVSTTVPAIEEIAGSAASLVPVGDADALAEALRTVWTDDDLRRRMIEAGFRQSERYSWERCLDGIVALYASATDAGRS